MCQGNVPLAGMERRESELFKIHPIKALAKAMGISKYFTCYNWGNTLLIWDLEIYVTMENPQ